MSITTVVALSTLARLIATLVVTVVTHDGDVEFEVECVSRKVVRGGVVA
jgi:hypothetical protein